MNIVLVMANESVAARRRVYFQLVDATDGMTPETGEGGGQPQVSVNGGSWTSTGIGTLTAIGNGRYYADLTQSLVDTTGTRIQTRYKSSNTAECPGDSVLVVAFNPHDAYSLGLGNVDTPISSRASATNLAVMSGQVTSISGKVNDANTMLEILTDRIPTTLSQSNIEDWLANALDDYQVATQNDLYLLQLHGDENWLTADLTNLQEGVDLIGEILASMVQFDEEAEAFQLTAHSLANAPTGSGGGGGGNVMVEGFTSGALKQLAQEDTGLTSATPGSVAALAQGAGALSDQQQQQLNNIEAKTAHITAGRVQLITPMIDGGRTLQLIRGDTYSDESPHGPLEWKPKSDSDWPDLTDAAVKMTVRHIATDEIVLEKTGSIVNPAGPGKAIVVTLTDEQTLNLTPSKALNDHKFDVQVTLKSGAIWTPVRGGDNLRSGGLTVIEDQTRPE